MKFPSTELSALTFAAALSTAGCRMGGELKAEFGIDEAAQTVDLKDLTNGIVVEGIPFSVMEEKGFPIEDMLKLYGDQVQIVVDHSLSNEEAPAYLDMASTILSFNSFIADLVAGTTQNDTGSNNGLEPLQVEESGTFQFHLLKDQVTMNTGTWCAYQQEHIVGPFFNAGLTEGLTIDPDCCPYAYDAAAFLNEQQTTLVAMVEAQSPLSEPEQARLDDLTANITEQLQYLAFLTESCKDGGQ